jgi:hypothetical protein
VREGVWTKGQKVGSHSGTLTQTRRGSIDAMRIGPFIRIRQGRTMAENPFHAECLKVLRILRELGGRMARRQLMRAMHCKAADFDQITETLVQQGEIEAIAIASKTKSAQGYCLT